jgi:metal-dependent amidase/aminoacylase/carboxypeptidase family protein
MKNIAWKQLEDEFEGLVDIRRNLHMYPELSFEGIKTPTMFEIRIKLKGEATTVLCAATCDWSRP